MWGFIIFVVLMFIGIFVFFGVYNSQGMCGGYRRYTPRDISSVRAPCTFPKYVDILSYSEDIDYNRPTVTGFDQVGIIGGEFFPEGKQCYRRDALLPSYADDNNTAESVIFSDGAHTIRRIDLDVNGGVGSTPTFDQQHIYDFPVEASVRDAGIYAANDDYWRRLEAQGETVTKYYGGDSLSRLAESGTLQDPREPRIVHDEGFDPNNNNNRWHRTNNGKCQRKLAPPSSIHLTSHLGAVNACGDVNLDAETRKLLYETTLGLDLGYDPNTVKLIPNSYGTVVAPLYVERL